LRDSTVPNSLGRLDFVVGGDVAMLRRELRRLVEEHFPPDILHALTDKPGGL
jgi:hypothetical protein